MKFLLVILFFAFKLVAAQHSQLPVPTITEGAKKNYRQIRKDVDKLTKLVIEGANSEAEKAAAIYHWITSNIAYDVRWLNGQKYTYNSKHVLKKRKTICRGYDWLFKQMCMYAGIKLESIQGYSKHLYHRNDRKINAANHVWNVMDIDGEYYMVDATFGAGKITRRKSPLMAFLSKSFGVTYKIKYKFVKSQNWQYFKSSLSTYLHTHHPDHPMWQLTHDTMNASLFIKSPETLDIWFRTEFGNLDSVQFYDYKNNINKYKEAKAKHSDILFVAKAAKLENKYNSFDMARGYLQQSGVWIHHEKQLLNYTNSAHIANVKECDSVLKILDSAAVWNRTTKSKLTSYTSFETRKINAVHRNVIKENISHQRKSNRQKSMVVKTMNQHKNLVARSKVLTKSIKGETNRVNKISTKVSVKENNRTPLAKYIREIDKIHRKRDSLNTLVAYFQSFKDSLSIYQQKYKLQIESNIVERAGTKMTQAGARWEMHYSYDSLIAQSERRHLYLETACTKYTDSIWFLVKTSYEHLKKVQALSKLATKLYVEERALNYYCKNLDNSFDLQGKLNESKTNWLSTLNAMRNLTSEYIDLHKQNHAELKKITKNFDENLQALKNENTCSQFAAKNYCAYEKYWHKLLKSECKGNELQQKYDKKWVVNYKKEAERKLREIERLSKRAK